jgi:ABC-type proline/glycine betaine transport system permease subunit
MGAYWLVIPTSAFFSLGLVSTLVAAVSLYAMSRVLRSEAA